MLLFHSRLVGITRWVPVCMETNVGTIMSDIRRLLDLILPESVETLAIQLGVNRGLKVDTIRCIEG